MSGNQIDVYAETAEAAKQIDAATRPQSSTKKSNRRVVEKKQSAPEPEPEDPAE